MASYSLAALINVAPFLIFYKHFSRSPAAAAAAREMGFGKRQIDSYVGGNLLGNILKSILD